MAVKESLERLIISTSNHLKAYELLNLAKKEFERTKEELIQSLKEFFKTVNNDTELPSHEKTQLLYTLFADLSSANSDSEFYKMIKSELKEFVIDQIKKAKEGNNLVELKTLKQLVEELNLGKDLLIYLERMKV